MSKEPVAYINIEKRTLEWAKPMRWETPTVGVLEPIPLYTHAGPAVVRQLVEALVKSEDLITGYLQTFAKRGEKMPYGHKVLSEVQSALAAAKGLGYERS